MDPKESIQMANSSLDKTKIILKYVLLYAGVASLWITISDYFIAFFDADIVQWSMFQTYKGLGFVIVTSILLFVLLHRHYHRVHGNLHKLKQTQDDLIENQLLYRNLVENSTDLIWSIDAEGRITFMNQASRQVYGREPEEMLGRLYTDFIPPEQIEPNIQAMQYALRNNDRVHSFENWVLHKDGHHVLLSANAVLLRDDEGQVVGSTGVSRDITKQKSKEKQLRLQSNLLDAVQQAVIVTNLDGKVSYWNHFAEQMYGWTSEQVIGRHITEVTVPHISGNQPQQIIDYIKKVGKWSGEFSVVDKKGREFPAYITNSLFYDEDKPAGIIGLSIDISRQKQMEETLKTTNNHLQTIIDVSPAAIVAIDPDHKVKQWNRAAEDIFGWHKDEVLDRPLPIVPDDRWHELENNVMTLRMTGGETDRHVVRQHKDGRSIDLSMSTTSFKDHQGEMLYLALFIDITQRLKARKELENAKTLLEKTFASLTEVVLIIEPNSRRVIMCNPAVKQTLGYTPEEVIGKDTGFLHVDEKSYIQFGNLSENALEEDSVFSIDYRMKHKDGHIIETTHTVALLNPEAGLAGGAVSVIRDITAQKQTLRELAHTLEQQRELNTYANTLRKIAENLVQSTQINETMEASLVELAKTLRYNSLTIYTIEQDQLVPIAHREYKPSTSTKTNIVYTKNKALHAALSVGRTLKLSEIAADVGIRSHLNVSEDANDWIAIPLISRGITMGLLCASKLDEKFSKNELELLEAFSYQVTSGLDNSRVYADLQKSYRQLQLAQEKTVHAARLSAIGEMAAGVAHQINNPLTTVIADSHLLLKHTELGTPVHESAQAISKAAHKAGNIVQRLLDFARTSPTKMTKIDINESLQYAINFVRSQIEPQHAKLETNFSEDIPPVLGSEEHLQDIWLNLILNARDAVHDVEGGLIQISTVYNKKDGKINIIVADNGIGIDADTLPNIFDPFYTSKERGTGLGLSICVDIVRQHQGTIDVESESGHGARFIIRLPSAK